MVKVNLTSLLWVGAEGCALIPVGLMIAVLFSSLGSTRLSGSST